MTELSATYDPTEVESRLYAWWESAGFFHAEPDDPGTPFAIVLPPPNVTGSLHIGHALVVSIEDAMIRHARMIGHNAVWLPGTDHAGIATQTVVERLLADEGLTRHDLGRKNFIERIWEFVEESGGTILRQERRLGASLDWDREIFTFDEQRSRAVREVFCRWYEAGLVYRGHRIINWCPRCRTALSDIEVDHTEDEGELVELRYPGADGSAGVVVATTRAETMLGDTGVAVHPDDERYAHLIGQTVMLPLMDRPIPVVADAHVDPEFGTGAVKVTPAHDPNDWEIGQRHGLEAIDIFTEDAQINANGGPYEGLDRFAAREAVKADLDALGLLISVSPRAHPVGHCSRCGTVVEPRLSDQWFVNVAPLAADAIAAVRDGRTQFIPERNAKGFLDWLENLHDWCISRQLWWGHQIPAWYDSDGNIHVRRSDPTPEEAAERGLTRDPDVLDTWFSSQLFPFVNLGWDGDTVQTPELSTWYPTTVLETGYDINTFWVSRMLMAGLSVMGEVPFSYVYNHGMVRDAQGKKMSKSFGNVIDPLDFVDKYGADALRFALLRASTAGQDAPLAEEWVEGARRFANKLWNAARFVLMSVGDHRPTAPAAAQLQLEDRWILSRLEASRTAVDEALETWDLGRVARTLYSFTWDEYCDWYLELAKLRVTDVTDVTDGGGVSDGGGGAAADGDADAARWTLIHVLDQSMRMLHPLMPFLTEEIWRTLHRADEATSLMRSEWATGAPECRDFQAEAEFEVLQQAVTELRRFRSDHGLAPARRISVAVLASGDRQELLDGAAAGICRLAGIEDWAVIETPPGETPPGETPPGETPPGETAPGDTPPGHTPRSDEGQPDDGPYGRVPLDGADLYVPLTGLIDLEEERERLGRELDKARAELRRADEKLANPNFVQKAPAPVVEAERAKVAEWNAAIDALTGQIDNLS